MTVQFACSLGISVSEDFDTDDIFFFSSQSDEKWERQDLLVESDKIEMQFIHPNEQQIFGKCEIKTNIEYLDYILFIEYLAK